MGRCRILFIALFAALSMPFYANASAPSPEFGVRAVYLDFRTQVMTLDAMKSFVSRAASRGMNAVIVEWEATFPFEQNATLCNRHAFSRAEVEEFVSYSTSLGVDVIPLQNCFGHCEYILRHERYASIREDKKDFSQVCPLKAEQAGEIFSSIFAEVAALHPSRYFHIGCDETRLLGRCPKCAEKLSGGAGVSDIWVDYVVQMAEIARSLGKIPIVWGDIILKYPEAADNLPRDIIIADWNYGWSKDYFGDPSRLLGLGFTMWGASALRSSPDNIFLTQWDKHLDNLRGYIPYCRAAGYSGIIDTSWSTSGQYGYTYENNSEVIDLQPIREVYPMSAFDMLEEAFACALKQNEPLDAKTFLDNYAASHFGLKTAEQRQIIVSYFLMKQPEARLSSTSESKISRLIDECVAMRRSLASVKPSRSKEDFSHLVLMLDIRINYLRFKKAEKMFESAGFGTEISPDALRAELGQLVKEASKLRARFEKLQKGYLKDPSGPFAYSYMDRMNNIYNTVLNYE